MTTPPVAFPLVSVPLVSVPLVSVPLVSVPLVSVPARHEAFQNFRTTVRSFRARAGKP